MNVDEPARVYLDGGIDGVRFRFSPRDSWIEPGDVLLATEEIYYNGRVQFRRGEWLKIQGIEHYPDAPPEAEDWCIYVDRAHPDDGSGRVSRQFDASAIAGHLARGEMELAPSPEVTA